MNLLLISRLYRVSICCVALAMYSTNATAQCTNSTTYEQWYATTVRLNGNDVRGYAEHAISGNYRYYWQMWLQSWNYLNGTQIGSYPNAYASPLGATAWNQYDATLSYWGPGNYSVTAYASSYTPYCNYWEPPWRNPASAYVYSNVTTVVRPARPDYAPGGHAVFYLGPGISYDGTYSNNTSLIAGNSYGAPETPQWVFAAGSQFGTLNPTTGNQPVFTATKRGTACLAFDVVLKTSYNGFLSDPFYMFINTPWNTIAANDKIGGTWVYSVPFYDGYATYINYKTMDMCGNVMYNLNYSRISALAATGVGAFDFPPMMFSGHS
jgi:hypothetical protein